MAFDAQLVITLYQPCLALDLVVEPRGIEPRTSTMLCHCSPSLPAPPNHLLRTPR